MVRPTAWQISQKLDWIFYIKNPLFAFKSHEFVLLKTITMPDRRNNYFVNYNPILNIRVIERPKY